MHPAKPAIKIRLASKKAATPLRPEKMRRNRFVTHLMEQRKIRVEIQGRNRFWQNAVMVEWNHQFPDRMLEPESPGFYLIAEDWLEDLQRVAAQCFSRALIAPADPGRRRMFRMLFMRDG